MQQGGGVPQSTYHVFAVYNCSILQSDSVKVTSVEKSLASRKDTQMEEVSQH